MPAQNLLNRCGKHPPFRFGGGAAVQHPPSPPHPEEQHTSLRQSPPQIQKPQTDMETDESDTDPEEFDEVVAVSLSELRNNVQCPICLGIIKKTRTVMGCLHRFCRECIDKSMRLGNNECPACRIHCASRHSLRDDIDFDAFVSSVYPDVDKYEEEEMVLHEEEKAVNEQVQASIAQISLRQSDAIAKASKTGGSSSRVPRNSCKCYSRRSCRSVYENQAELSWGRARVRSHTRYGGLSSCKVALSKRIQKLANHLANVQKEEHEHVGSMIATHLQNDKPVWLNDHRTSNFDSSTSMDVLKLIASLRWILG